MKNINNNISTLIVLSFLIAGTGKSVGTAGGSELLIPTGAKGIALNGANAATVHGADALYYNPAGVSNTGSGVETQFSNTKYIADIGMNYLALASNVGTGTFAFSLKSFDFGDIPYTTAFDPTNESGQTFSPQYLTLTAGYSKAYTDRIRFGASIKLVNETIMQTSANGLALDLGVQYTHGSLPLNLGIILKNLGPKLQYTGSNLEQSLQPDGSESGTIDEHFQIISQPFDLPASLNIAATYSLIPSLNLHGSFENNSFGFNQFHGGVEYNLSIGGMDVWVGGGTNLYLIDDNTDSWDEDLTKNNFGSSFGGGFSVPIGSLNLGVDYGIRSSETFANSGVLAFNVGF